MLARLNYMEIIVPSTHKYSDAWGPFVALFRKFWPDCQFPLTLITDTQNERWDGDEAIVIGEDKGWCRNFLLGLQKVDADFILLMQEDFFLNRPVDKAFIARALKMMLDDDKIGCFRLYPCPGPDVPLGDDYGLIKPDAPYRVSCQSAIWRKTTIIEVLARNNSPREFEIDGTRQMAQNGQHWKFLSVMREPNAWPLQYYCSAITRGEWTPDSIEFVKSHGIPIDTSRRGVMRVLP